MEYYIYILSNNLNTLVYTGVTRDLVRCVYEHKHQLDPDSYTAKYNIHKLIYFGSTSDEKQPLNGKNKSKAGIGKEKINW